VLAICILPAQLFSQIERAIENYVSDTVFNNAGISICIRDVNTDEILVAYNENMALTSASVMKLVTTGTSLEILHPDYRFYTRVGYAGRLNDGILNGHVIIKGGGDPVLGSEYFNDHYGDFIKQWAGSIAEAGIKKINGRVIADASIFEYSPAAPGWSWADLGNYYGAGVFGISVFDNMYRIIFNTGEPGTRPEIKGLVPEIPGLIINNQLISEGKRDLGYIYLPPYGDYAEIKGTIPARRDSFALKASMPDPPYFIARLLHNELLSLGIEISEHPTTLREYKQYIKDNLLNEAVVTFQQASPALYEIIKCTNLESVNLFAETLAWILDYENSGYESANLNGGLDVIYDFLESRKLNTSGLYMTDGSGLSRSNALSSSFISSYLVYMSSKATYPDLFKNSLARPGEGTFESYFLSPELKNNLRGKSGTVNRVRNYAGYLVTKSGRQIAFGILHNNFDCNSHQVSKRVEKLLTEVYNYY
jgi:D-alanyl-D-alanine carboxypeptidase/D-alanyl-D-alanine-endopeptidase (penicillin-binding protein 4)